MTEKTVAAGLVTVAVEGVTFRPLRPSEKIVLGEKMRLLERKGQYGRRAG